MAIDPLTGREKTITTGGTGTFNGQSVKVDHGLSTPRTTVTANPSANGGAQFWADQRASIQRIPQPSTSPGAQVSIQQPDAPRMLRPQGGGYAFDQAVRAMEMAQNKAEFDSKKVHRSRARDAANQGVINFWADQAASVGPGAAQRMAELQAQQQNENFRTLSNNAAQQSVAAGNNEARAAEGAADRTFQLGQNVATRTFQAEQADADRGLRRNLSDARLQAQMNAPQLVTANGGVMGYTSPNGGFTALRDQGGNHVLAPQPSADPRIAIAGINAISRENAAILGNPILNPDERAAGLAASSARYGGGGRQVVSRGTYQGRPVVQYSDGTVDYEGG